MLPRFRSFGVETADDGKACGVLGSRLECSFIIIADPMRRDDDSTIYVSRVHFLKSGGAFANGRHAAQPDLCLDVPGCLFLPPNEALSILAADLGGTTRVHPLTIAIGNYGLTKPLKDGSVRVADLNLEYLQVDPIVAAMRRMVRSLEFDICEMAFTTYLCAKAYGKPVTAIPVFLTRNFHHWAIFYNVNSGIALGGTPRSGGLALTRYQLLGRRGEA